MVGLFGCLYHKVWLINACTYFVNSKKVYTYYMYMVCAYWASVSEPHTCDFNTAFSLLLYIIMYIYVPRNLSICAISKLRHAN